jgi:hypothetical protein
MKPRAHEPALILALAWAFLGILAPPAAAQSSPAVETTATLQEGAAALTVRAFGQDGELKGQFGGAGVYLNRGFSGYAPYSVSAIAPGNWLVGVAADGYYPQEFLLAVQEKTSYTLTFALQRRMGWLSTVTTPPDAEVLVDGKPGKAGVQRLPTGRHEVLVRRFGYAERSYDVVIEEDATTSLVAALALAPFEAGPLRVSRPAFDPRNAGQLGSTSFSFSVTSWGSGSLTVLSPSGETVAAFDFPLFETWNQRVDWRGRSPTGAPLPDGSYRVILKVVAVVPGATQAGGQAPVPAPAPAAVEREAEVRIDGSLAVSPLGPSGGGAGLLFFPEPGRLPPGLKALGFGLHADQASLAGTDSLSIEAAGVFSAGFLTAGASVSMKGSGSGAFAAGIGISAPFAPAGSGPNASLYFAASWTGEEALGSPWTATGRAASFGLELSLPSSLALGDFRLGLSPGLLLSLPTAPGTASVSPLYRAGLWYAGRLARLGLSALMAAESFSAPLSPAWPIEVAAEATVAVDPSPLVLSAALTCGIDAPSLSWGFRLGLSFLF